MKQLLKYQSYSSNYSYKKIKQILLANFFLESKFCPIFTYIIVIIIVFIIKKKKKRRRNV